MKSGGHHVCAVCGFELIKPNHRKKRNGRRFGGKLVHRGCIPRKRIDKLKLLLKFRSEKYVITTD